MPKKTSSYFSIRIAKCDEKENRQLLILYLWSLVAAFALGGIFLAGLKINPFLAYSSIVSGAFRSSLAFQGTIKIAIPLLISSLGVMLAFKMKFWNIGAEGQIIMGAVFATYFALFCNDWPHWILLPVMFLAGFCGGGLWGLIPAFFKSKFNTNETLFTLMLNYVALYLIKYLTEGPWNDPTALGFPKIATFVTNARLDKLFGIHSGWVVALFLVLFVFVYMKYTKMGYEIDVVGDSKQTANYAGMSVFRIVLSTMFLSGGICGIAGMIQATGAAYTLGSGIAGGVGFTAIIVAWLARLNPLIILFVSLMFAVLEKGCGVMQSTFGISTAVSDILQGIILFTILGFDFFSRYKLIFRNRRDDYPQQAKEEK